MEKILFDFSALKSGGGCQLAINFIYQMKAEGLDKHYILLLPDQGPVYEEFNQQEGFHYYLYPSGNYLSRFLYETFRIKRIFNKEGVAKVFTFFGAGLKKVNGVKSIVSVAYPIICYEDSPYWKYVPKWVGLKKRVINYLRVSRLRQSDVVFVETDIMLERLKVKLDRPNIKYIQMFPAPSDFVEQHDQRFADKSKTVNILILSGTAPHKNLWRLTAIASELRGEEIDFKFILSCNLNYFKGLPDWEDWMVDVFDCRGTVVPTQISSLYLESNFLLSLSDLESFSNNYMEAWKTNTTLLVSDRDFSRHICETSAIYFDPHSPKQVTEKVKEVLESRDLQLELVKQGRRRLDILLDQETRFEVLLERLKEL